MRISFSIAAVLLFANAAEAQCTVDEATQKMQTILASDAYRDVVSRTGEGATVSPTRSAVRSGLRAFGGALGGIGADVMTDQDVAQNASAANESASDTKALTTLINDAGEALGNGDTTTACLLYDTAMNQLGLD